MTNRNIERDVLECIHLDSLSVNDRPPVKPLYNAHVMPSPERPGFQHLTERVDAIFDYNFFFKP